MRTDAYLAQLRERLSGLGFTQLENPRLAYVGRRDEEWGQLTLALAPFGAENRAELVSAVGAMAEQGTVILVFPFERRVPEELSKQILALRTARVIPWVFDGQAELLDQHAGPPKVDLAVIRALTEVPGAAASALPRVAMPRMELGMGYVPTTRVALAATISFYLWVLMMGGVGDMLSRLIGGPPLNVLIAWGANHGGLVLEQGQHWRLFTYMLLHGSLMHLGFNMWALWSLGRHVEMIYGSTRTLFIYVAAGVVGGMASAMLRPGFVPSVGASGAIFGLMGALLYFTVGMGRTVDWREVLAPFISTFLYGLFLGAIDHYAHVGGFIGGFLAAFLAGIPGQRSPWRVLAMGLGVVALLVILSGLVPLPHLV